MSESQKSRAWYAVRTRSNFEKKVSNELDSKGIETFFPFYSEVRQWKDRKKVVEQPLFPGYLLSRMIDTNEARLAILKTPGAVQILGQGLSIEPVPNEQVEAIRTLLEARVSCFAHPFLREGSRVRIRAGALKGLEGFLAQFKNQFRLVLTVELLGRSVATEVDIENVQPLAARPSDHRRVA